MELEGINLLISNQKRFNPVFIKGFINLIRETLYKLTDVNKLNSLLDLIEKLDLLKDVFYKNENLKSHIVYISIVNPKSLPSISSIVGNSNIELEWNKIFDDKQIKIELFKNYVPFFCKLLKMNFNLNYQYKNGDTALHIALKTLKLESAPVIAALLVCGANPNIRNNKSTFPFHKAIKHGDDNIIKILLAFGAKPYLEDLKSSKKRDPGMMMKEKFSNGIILKIVIDVSNIIKTFNNYMIQCHAQTFVLLEILGVGSMNIIKSPSFYGFLVHYFPVNMSRIIPLIEGKDAPPLQKYSEFDSFDITLLTDFIGRGSFGEVFKLKYKIGDEEKMCAVKKCGINKKNKDEVVKEVESMYLSQSPSIIGLYGYFYDGNYLYLFLEYCSKGTLFDVLRNEKMTSFDDFFRFAFGVVHCTFEIHTNTNGILIHRDLKSKNFLVNDMDLIKLCDFGSARVFSTENQETLKKTAGTPSFQPPEATTNTVANTKTDIYALGVVLYEMCAPIPYIGVNYIYPFGNLRDNSQINLAVGNFLRPILHDSIPLPLSDLIYSMLSHNDYDRPSELDCFTQLNKIEKIYSENKEKWNSIFNKINIEDDLSDQAIRQHKISKIIEKKYKESKDSTFVSPYVYNEKLIINYAKGCIEIND
ncbi:hypothetical protein ACTFIY_010776 [Dictyostelium cf. discoideum]